MNLVQPGGISFEFFPPKTDNGEAALWQAITELEQLGPDFVSVTYGAGGSTRDRTLRITARIKADTNLLPIAHLTCVGSSRQELSEIITQLLDAGINSLMALRGDPPQGSNATWQPHPAGLQYAVELVELAKSAGMKQIGVAAFPEQHPQSPSLDFDIEVLKAKQLAGADFAITQLFFDSKSYFDLIERAQAAGVSIPIRPGIMPLTEIKQLDKFSALAGLTIPDQVKTFFTDGNPSEQEVANRGVQFATELAEILISGGAPGIHLYTMNKATAAKQVYWNLQK